MKKNKPAAGFMDVPIVEPLALPVVKLDTALSDVWGEVLSEHA